MPVLIGIGVLALFAAALLDPYGRRLLATMAAIIVAIGIVWWAGFHLLNPDRPTAPAAAASGDPWAKYADKTQP